MARLFRPRRRRRDQKQILRDRVGNGAAVALRAETARPSRQCGDGVTFQTEAETARLRNNFSWPLWKRCEFGDQSGDFPDQGWNGATFQTRAEMVRLFRPRRRRRDFPHQSRDGPTIQTTAEMARPRTNLSRPWWKRWYFGDQSGDGATFQTKVETARLSGPKQRWCDYSDQGGDGATKEPIFRNRFGSGATLTISFETFQTKAEMERLLRPRPRRPDQERILRARDGSCMTFALRVETARISKPKRGRRDFLDRCGDGVTKKRFSWQRWERRNFGDQRGDGASSRPRRRRCDFLDQSGVGATFQNYAETAWPRNDFSWPWWKQCNFGDQSGDGVTKKQFFGDRGGSSATLAIRVQTAQLSTSKWARRDFLDRCGDGVTKKRFSWPRCERRNFGDQSGDGATSRPRRRHARLSRPKRRWRDFSDQGSHDLAKFLKNFL